MKKLVTAFAIATLVATPAFAKTSHPRQSAATQAVGPFIVSEAGYDAYAAANGDNAQYGPARDLRRRLRPLGSGSEHPRSADARVSVLARQRPIIRPYK